MAHIGFTKVICPFTMQDDDNVKLMIKLRQKKYLEEWYFGLRKGYISSSFVTKDGVVDVMTSPNKKDRDYSSLLEAHFDRAMQHLISGDEEEAYREGRKDMLEDIVSKNPELEEQILNSLGLSNPED